MLATILAPCSWGIPCHTMGDFHGNLHILNLTHLLCIPSHHELPSISHSVVFWHCRRLPCGQNDCRYNTLTGWLYTPLPYKTSNQYAPCLGCHCYQRTILLSWSVFLPHSDFYIF